MTASNAHPARGQGALSKLPSDLHHLLTRIEFAAIIAALLGIAGLIIAAIFDYAGFLQGYLVGFFFWFSIPVGAICLLMLHHLVGGRWGALIRRPLEAAALTFPLLAVCFVAIALGLPDLYPWARPDVVAIHAELQHKAAYLNPTFVLVRAAGFFVVWSLLGWLLRRDSLREPELLDDAHEDVWRRRFQNLAGPGLVVVALTASFAVIDWLQSLEPLWFSSEYPMMIMVGQLLSASAFFILVLILLSRIEPIATWVSPQMLNDLGNIMLVFVVLWAYTEFMQYLIIWSGNTHERIPWYVARSKGGWGVLIALLALVQFFVALFALLFKKLKQDPVRLGALALVIMLMRGVDAYWVIIPAFYPDGFAFVWPALAAVVGIGGAWVWLFCRFLRRAPLMAPRSIELFVSQQEASQFQPQGGTQ